MKILTDALEKIIEEANGVNGEIDKGLSLVDNKLVAKNIAKSLTLDEEKITSIVESILDEFGISCVVINTPKPSNKIAKAITESKEIIKIRSER